MDPYKILRIHPGASKNEIEEAASRMLKIWNPDEFEEYKSVAQKVSRDINKAKNMLLDPETRINFDKTTKHGELLPEVALYTISGNCVKYKRPWVSCVDNRGRQTNDNDLNDNNQIALWDFNFGLHNCEQYFEKDPSLGTAQKFPSDNVIYGSNDPISEIIVSGGNTKVQTCRSDSTFELEKFQKTSNSSLTDSTHDIENYLWMENTDTTYILKGKKNPRQSYTLKSDTFLLPAKDRTSRNKNNFSSDINISLFDSYVVVKDDFMVNDNGLGSDYLKKTENFVKKSQSDSATLFRDSNLKVETRNQIKSASDEKLLSINNTNNGRNVSPSFTYIKNKDDLQNEKCLDSGSENKILAHTVNDCFSDSAISFTKSSLTVESLNRTNSASDEKTVNINNFNNDRNVSSSFAYRKNRDDLQVEKNSDSGLENETKMTHTVNDCFSDSAISFTDNSLKIDSNTQMHKFRKYYVNKHYSSDEINILKESGSLDKKSNVNWRLNDVDNCKTKKDDPTIKLEKSNPAELNSDQNVSPNKDLVSNHLSSDQNQSNNLKKNKISDSIKYDEDLDMYIKGLKTSLSEICIPKHNVKEYTQQPGSISGYFDVRKVTKKQKHAMDTDLLNQILTQSREIDISKTKCDNQIHQIISKENSVPCTKMTDTDDLENSTENFREKLTKSVSDSNTTVDKNQKKRSRIIDDIKKTKESVNFENVDEHKVNKQTENDTDHKKFEQEEFEIPVIFKKKQIKEIDCKALKTSLQSPISKEPPHYIINKINTDKYATASFDFVRSTANSFSSEQRASSPSTDIKELDRFSDIFENSITSHHHVQKSKSENEIIQKDEKPSLKIQHKSASNSCISIKENVTYFSPDVRKFDVFSDTCNSSITSHHSVKQSKSENEMIHKSKDLFLKNQHKVNSWSCTTIPENLLLSVKNVSYRKIQTENGIVNENNITLKKESWTGSANKVTANIPEKIAYEEKLEMDKTFNNKRIPLKESLKSEQHSSFQSESSSNQHSDIFSGFLNNCVNDTNNSSQDHKDFQTKITEDICIQDISGLKVQNMKIIKLKKGCLLKCTTWVGIEGESRIDISDLKGLSKTAYYEDQEWQVIRSSAYLKDFEMVSIYRFSNENESLSVYLEGNLACKILNDEPVEVSNEYLKSSECIPLTMTTIMKVNNNILAIIRIRERESDCIQIFKNGLLIYVLENQLAEE